MGWIYEKKCSKTGKIYYGSFEDTLQKRLRTGWKKCTCADFVNPSIRLIEEVLDNNNLVERELWYIQNNECVNKIGKYMHLSKEEYKKQYRDDNKEKFKEYHKQYRQDNKEEINAKAKEKVVCDNCCSIVNRSDISRHKKTKKCIKEFQLNNT